MQEKDIQKTTYYNNELRNVLANIANEINDLQTSLDDKADTNQAHNINDVKDLQTELNNKSNITHSHKQFIDDINVVNSNVDGSIRKIYISCASDRGGLGLELNIILVIHMRIMDF